MKYLKLILGSCLCLFVGNAMAQQHLTKGWSVSAAAVLNTKGVNATLHYHLNSFDELRLSIYRTQETYLNPAWGQITTLKTEVLSVEYVMGFKYQDWKSMGMYLGIGSFWGAEKMDIVENGRNSIYGLSFFHELEYAPIPQLAFLGRFKMLIPFKLKRSKTLRLVLGTRFYF